MSPARRTKVKVCGVRTLEDVALCVRHGVDFVGFNFWPGSKRYLAPQDAAPLVAHLAALAGPGSAIGVFAETTPASALEAVRASGVAHAQLHDVLDVTPFLQLGVPVIPVVRVRQDGSYDAPVLATSVATVVLDAWTPGYGGVGASFDLGLVPAIHERLGRDVLIAGGLTPENVRSAVLCARPWGVDVASGVERSAGVKDEALVRAFLEAVRDADGDWKSP